MKNEIGNIMNQVQQMQQDMQQAQEKIAKLEVSGESGAGMVKITMTCKHEVKHIHIDPSLLQEDKEMLEDLLAAAINDANRRIEEVTQSKMSGLIGNLGLATGMKLPF